MSKFLKITVMGLASTFMWGCAARSVDPQTVLQPVVKYQCHQELKTSKVWKAMTLLVGETKQQEWQNQACECISENALKDVPTETLLKATVNEDTKNELIRQAIANSLKGCMAELVK
jgi:hypothetical protein